MSTTPNYVPGEGNGFADLAVVGEAPGTEENNSGRPFTGEAGKFLNTLFEDLGLDRGDFWVTNVSKYQPPANNFSRLHEVGVDLSQAVRDLRTELRDVGVNCTLVLGENAMNAMTGKKGISNWRGSVLNTPGGKVIPTFHPAAFLYRKNKWEQGKGQRVFGYYNREVLKLDIQRALEQSKFRQVRNPKRTLHICRSFVDLYRFFQRNKHREYLSIDIEVANAFPVCIGLAFTPFEAMSIPLLPAFGSVKLTRMGPSELARVWKLLAQILMDPRYKKVGQNFKFDRDKLTKLGLSIDRLYFDTQLGSHTCNSELPKSLEFNTSTRTLEPFYKWEGREFKLGKDNFENFQTYNCKDCCVTLEVMLDQLEEIEELGLTRFFFDFVMPLHDLYWKMEEEGWKIDLAKREGLDLKYSKMRAELQVELDVTLGAQLNVKSIPQCKSALFDILGLPERQSTDEDTLVSMLSGSARSDEQARKVINGILDIRKIRDQISRYIRARPDYDGRMRTSTKITGAETGRSATGILQRPVRPQKIGIAMQTLTKHGEFGTDIRAMLVPDDGYVFLSVDQAQAEARVVALLAEDYKFLELIDRVDVHRMTAGWIFGKEPEAIGRKSVERIIGKTVRHAGNYDMGAKRLCDLVTTDTKKQGLDYPISLYRAKQILGTFHDRTPNIRDVFHKQIKQALNETRELISPCSHLPGVLGRRRHFFDRWSKEMWKEGYAQIPQASVSDHTKGVALRIKEKIPGIRIILEAHDGLDFLVPKGEVNIYARTIQDEFLHPIDFRVCSLPRGELIIPVEAQVAEDNFKDFVDFEIAA